MRYTCSRAQYKVAKKIATGGDRLAMARKRYNELSFMFLWHWRLAWLVFKSMVEAEDSTYRTFGSYIDD